jgi:ABC-type multidrug transport system permease subunit
VIDGAAGANIVKVLSGGEFVVSQQSRDDAARRLRTGKSDITVEPTAQGFIYRFDPSRPESALARAKVNLALEDNARPPPIDVHDQLVQEPGARYIDFLVPGLIGMNMLGGGIWGIGFVTVDMRIRRLLKRMVATPMKKGHFLIAMVGGRMFFMLPELILILLMGVLLFGMRISGSLATIVLLAVLGATAFAGMGLLVASRADRMETVVGLANLATLPMWLLSGVFFSADKFPGYMQWFIQALPLTQLNNALRAVMLEGASLTSQWLPIAVLIAWGGLAFVLALRLFRWT